METTEMKRILGNLTDLLTRHEIRVAVCGMQNSGKTVFLTSLADHFLHHDPHGNRSDDRRFDLNGYVVGDNADVVDVHSSGDAFGNFEFRDFRKDFAKNEWPEKTGLTTELVIDFTLRNKDSHLVPVGRWSANREIRLRFLDIPGERLADFIMDGRDFAEWSDALLGNGKRGRRHLDDYRDAADALAAGTDDEAAESALLDYYRQALDGALKVFDRFVTPSVYRVPLDGKKESPRLLGLAGGEFAPMPASARKRFPALARLFARRYAAYRKAIVAPIVDWMKTADKALFLLDVFACINGGAQAYNGSRAETEAALDVFASGGARRDLAEAASYLATRFELPMQARNVRIVVTKMDMADEQGRENLLALAREMFGKKVEAVTGFRSPDSAILPCAAVATDRKSSAGSGLEKSVHKGIPRERSDARPGDGVPWSVPENLDDWKGRFPLKDLNPAWFNLRDDLPPKHAGLDAVARFILDIK